MDEMVHVEAEGLDIVHVLVSEMLTSLEMFRIGVPVMHEYQRDEPLLIPLLLGKDNNQYDEERRLFYVAMTRAKDAAYFVSYTKRQSDFFKELFPYNGKDGDKVQMVCPVCGGALILKTGKFGMFYGCSNFASRGCRFTRKFSNGSEDQN